MPKAPPLEAFNDLPQYKVDNMLLTPQSMPAPMPVQTEHHADLFEANEPLILVPSDNKDLKLVGVEAPVPQPQALHQPKPLPPPQESSQWVQVPTCEPNADYYDAVQCQENCESPIVHKPPPPPPLPYSEEPPEQLLWDINVGDVDHHGEQEVNFALNLESDKALLLAGQAFVEHGVDLDSFGAGTMASENAAEWHKAMCKEMNSLPGNGTWQAIYLLVGHRAIGSWWGFKVKHLPDGAIEQFKVCVVVQSFSQQPGVDFDETFAPTDRWAAVCMVLALAALEDLHLESVDSSSAFLHGIVDAELYMRFPKGFPEDVQPGIEHQPGNGIVCAKLEKGIYGLKQGANLWNKWMHEVLLKLGFVRITSNPCVYVYL
ncbi:hypothetical protein E4T56_gene18423 [Termitomyces sp. T112]|nr:hypothetical protein E4T56_gene18423 [Termitomyces sp. T112]